MTTGERSPILFAQGLSRSFAVGSNQVHALREVSLAINSGEFVALMGSSGSGKSTLLHLLGCLDVPSGGQYQLEGQDVTHLSPAQRAEIRRRRLGFVFQSFFLIPSLTALENVALPLLYDGQVRQDVFRQAAAALEQMGLGDRMNHRPNELSGGQRQRVAIARALVYRPAILLADEPTGNLDSKTGQEVMALLTSLWQQGLTILVVTHDSVVARCAQRILIMRDGQIVREERKHELHQ